LLDDAAGCTRPHQAGDADAFTTRDEQFGKRERQHDRALEFAVARVFRCERHRPGAVGPQPHGVRGLPFLFADIKQIVARRAAPVDALGSLAGDEAAILPEVLACAGASAPMQAVDHG